AHAVLRQRRLLRPGRASGDPAAARFGAQPRPAFHRGRADYPPGRVIHLSRDHQKESLMANQSSQPRCHRGQYSRSSRPPLRRPRNLRVALAIAGALVIVPVVAGCASAHGTSPVSATVGASAPATHAAPAPPPPATSAAPVSAPKASCTPLSDENTCYEPGEYCRDDDHGVTGVAGDGEAIRCEDNDGWRWEPV